MDSLDIAMRMRCLIRRPDPDETPLSDSEVLALVLHHMERGKTPIPLDLTPSIVERTLA